jgi:hypothetical protein
MAQLPLLLLQAQLQLHLGLQCDHHLLEPAVELISGQQVLAPMQPYPLDAAVDTGTTRPSGNHPMAAGQGGPAIVPLSYTGGCVMSCAYSHLESWWTHQVSDSPSILQDETFLS